MAEEIVYLPVETVRAFMVEVFLALGVPPDDAVDLRRDCEKILSAQESTKRAAVHQQNAEVR